MVSEYAYTYGRWPAVSVTLGMNGIIHVFLYYYYGICALQPGKRPAWKKQLTQLQLIQFMVGLCHLTVGYLHHGWCTYGIWYELTMIWLFSHFYYQAYIKERVSVKKLEWILFYTPMNLNAFYLSCGTNWPQSGYFHIFIIKPTSKKGSASKSKSEFLLHANECKRFFFVLRQRCFPVFMRRNHANFHTLTRIYGF